MVKTSCILFDLGGVLINWKNRWLVNEISRRYELDKHKLYEEFSKLLPLLYCGKINENEFWKGLGNKMDSDNLSNNTISLFEEIFRKHASINNTLVDLAFRIQKSGIKIGLLSNNEPAKIKVVKEWIPIQNFDYVFLSHQVGVMKPDKKIYQHILEKVPYDSNEIILVDDRKQNVEVAKQLGIDGIEFLNFEKIVKDFASRDLTIN